MPVGNCHAESQSIASALNRGVARQVQSWEIAFRRKFARTGRRGGQASQRINVTVVSTNAASARFVSGLVITNRDLLVRCAGAPGFTGAVEFTDTFSPKNWRIITHVTAPATNPGRGAGVFEPELRR